jgi:uncharacterized membrane protein YphA (DoxX/SURF4 family)
VPTSLEREIPQSFARAGPFPGRASSSAASVGLTLAAHGTQKLFGWFGGPGRDATGQFFAMLGFPPRRRHALMAGLAEAGGSLLLALGSLTPVAAALVLSVMLVAAVTVHIKKGFFAQNVDTSTPSSWVSPRVRIRDLHSCSFPVPTCQERQAFQP